MVATPAIPRKVTTILLAGGSVTVDASSYLPLTLNRFSRAAVKGHGRLIITGTQDLLPVLSPKNPKSARGMLPCDASAPLRDTPILRTACTYRVCFSAALLHGPESDGESPRRRRVRCNAMREAWQAGSSD
jgi:hypothetical protein